MRGAGVEIPALTEKLAVRIFKGFETYLVRFRAVTRRARKRFETMDWRRGRQDAIDRLGIYDDCIAEATRALHVMLDGIPDPEADWPLVKQAYSDRVGDRCDRDIAETFFNSVTRKVFNTTGIDRTTEFIRLDPPEQLTAFCTDLFTKYEGQTDATILIWLVLSQHAFRIPYANLARDITRVANEINLFLWPLTRKHAEYTAEILNHVFFRNKVAYIIGRMQIDAHTVPLILPMYNSEDGIYIDAVLLTRADVNNIFGFAYSYFHVETDAPNDLVHFLQSMLPGKPISEIYNSIGYNKHGKTEFYRDLHRHVHIENEKFVLAPGLEGAVMIVYTQPHYPYVFKVIKDRPCFLRSTRLTNKSITADQVKARYRFVSSRDRVGRLVDTQEFESIRFRLERYDDEVVNEFALAARETVRVVDGYLIIDHCYIQRKVVPLPIFLETETSPEHIRQILLDFGYFIKDLAGTGLFPVDLFNKWNYGVGERSRVVLYDYDDIMPLESVSFHVKPKPRDEYEEYQSDEDRITADENDFFMDEIETWLGIPTPLKGIFDAVHRDLYTKEFWERTQRSVRRGEVVDIFPYDRGKRFS